MLDLMFFLNLLDLNGYRYLYFSLITKDILKWIDVSKASYRYEIE